MLGVNKRIICVVSCALGVVLAGCSWAPKHYSPDTAELDIPEYWQSSQFGEPQSPDTLLGKQAGQLDLLSLLPSLNLESKLEPLFSANPSFQRRLYQLLEQRALQGQSEAALLPSLNITADRDRAASAGQKASSQHSLRLSSSWELDVWGRLSDQLQAAELDSQALALEIEYAKRSLLSDVIQQALFLSNGRLALELEERRLASALKNEQLIHRRYKAGLGSLRDLNVAQTESYQRRAAIEVLREGQLNYQRDLQRLFADFELPTFEESTWQDVQFPEISMPAMALAQRPDLQAAFKKIKAADLRSEYSYKQLLPSFTINANLFNSQLKTADLLSSDPSWNLLGQLSQSLFQGGRIKSEIKAAEARAAQAYWSYKEALLGAFFEVDSALSKEASLAKQEQALKASLRYAQRSHIDFEQRYQRGLSSIFDVLSAQRTSFDLQAQLLQLQLDRASNRLNLALVMGLPIKAKTI